MKHETEQHDVDLTGQAVLVVDDERDVRDLIRALLEEADLPIAVIEEAADGTGALEALRLLRRQYATVVVVLDKQLPGIDGLEVARLMLDRDPSQAIVLFTGFLTDEVREAATHLGVTACVTKTAVRTLPSVIGLLLTDPDGATKPVGGQIEGQS